MWKSVRNLRDVTTTLAHQLNPYDLLDCEQLLLTQDGEFGFKLRDAGGDVQHGVRAAADLPGSVSAQAF